MFQVFRVILANTDTQGLLDFLKVASAAGGTTTLLAVVIALWRGDLRLKREVDWERQRAEEFRSDRDEWKRIAIENGIIAKRAAIATEKATEVAKVAATALPQTPNQIE